MKILLLTFAFLTASSYGVITILSVDFTGQARAAAKQPVILNPIDFAGVVSDDLWHDAPNNVNSLTFSEMGLHTFTWSSSYSQILPNFNTNSDEQMMNGYISAAPHIPMNLNVSFDLSALCPGATSYDVYVYADSMNAGGGTANYDMSSLGYANTINWSNLSPDYGMGSGYVQAMGGGAAGNYMIFSGLTDPNFQLQVSTNDLDLAPLNGIQIVPRETPEASTSLFGAFTTLLMLTRRKRNHA